MLDNSQIRGGTIYTSTARFDNSDRALTEDEMRASVPSIFATTAHHSRSDRFKPIPTIEVIRALSKEGLYYDPRGAWREWGEYKTFKEAKESAPDSYEWMIEKRASYIISQSENASKYGHPATE